VTLRELESLLRSTHPNVRLVGERSLKTLLAVLADRGERVARSLHRPIEIEIAGIERLGILPQSACDGVEPTRRLLVEPDDRFPGRTISPEIVRHYLREVLCSELQHALAGAHESSWRLLPETVRVEATFVLGQLRLVPSEATDAEYFAAFASEYLSWDAAEPAVAKAMFPSVDPAIVKPILIRNDVVKKAIADVAWPSTPQLSATTSSPAAIVPITDARQLAKEARERKNDVRAAIYLERAGKHGEAVALLRSTVLPRLAPILGWSNETRQRWDRALAPVLAAAGRRYWSQAAKCLYDLQKLAVDLEGDLSVVDAGGWIASFGQRPLVRTLSLSRRAILSKQLKRAAKHLRRDAALLEAGEFDALLAGEIERADENLREAVRPILIDLFVDAAFVPSNAIEVVARDKIVEELLDVLCERGHTRLADVRDAFARNRLKMTDLWSPVEFSRGDKLLQYDRLMYERLDGLHHRGEVYLRIIQRLSAVAFGTGIGRFATKFIGLPFGAAVLVVEFSKYIVMEGDMVAKWIAGLASETPVEPEPAKSAKHDHGPLFTQESLIAIGVLGVLFLLLIHVPAARNFAGRVLGWIGSGFKFAFIDGPMRLWNLAPLRRFRSHATTLYFLRTAGWPLVFGLALGGVLLALGASWPKVLAWSGGILAIGFIALNVPFVRRCLDDVEEVWSDSWRYFWTSLIPGLISGCLWLFRELLGALDRWIYTVDEWFRFRPGASKPSLVLKAILSFVWFPIAYVIRFAFYLLIEPQVNPVKHFPVVTVSHKLLLPMIPALAKSLNLSLELVGGIISGIPGIFGFIVWELKENWRLYEANRPESLDPVPLGHHGETMNGLLRPGFHSGTIPTSHRKLLKATIAEPDRDHGRDKPAEALHHVERALHHFVEREWRAPLRLDAAWKDHALSCGSISLGWQRATISIDCESISPKPFVLAIQRVDDAITATVADRGFAANLDGERLAQWDMTIRGVLGMLGAAEPVGYHDWREFWGRHSG